MSHAVFLDYASVDRDDLDAERLYAAIPDWTLHPETPAEDVAARIAGARVIVSNKVVLGREHLEGAKDLQLIAVAATGTNNIDLEAAAERDIAVTNVRAYGTPSITQHVFALLLALTTRLDEHRRAASDGTWADSNLFCELGFPFRELAGKTMGIVGLGELGRGVARLAEAFGMRVLVAQRPGGAPQEGRVPLAELLPLADVLSLHLPLTAASKNLISTAELALMKSDAVLLNTARGGIVDEQALADALRNGVIGGAGVDVLSEEPPRTGNPLLADDIPNLIVTPHVAWAARESRQRVLDQVGDCIAAFLGGEALNRVV